MAEHILTICIPSYRRLQQAMRTVRGLLPSVDGEHSRILVLDNASPDDYAGAFRSDPALSAAIDRGVLEISRNPTNIGMSANFLRAFEMARGEWLWLLSDDDEVEADAIGRVLSAIRTVGDEYGFVKFGSTRRPAGPKNSIDDFEEFIDRNARSVDDFNDFIFISNGIYRLKDFRSILEVGYKHAHTYVPHFMLMSAFMSRGGRMAIVNEEIVDYVVPEIGYSYGMLAGLGVGGTKSLLFKLRPGYSKRFYSLFFPHNDFKVIIDLYFNCKRDATPEVYRYHARNYCHLVSVARSPLRVLMLRGFLEVGRVPAVFEFMLRTLGAKSAMLNKHLDEIKARYGFLDGALSE
ncbi:Abequosyltransferase RfbV [Pandoraea communis]|uniref:Abequosyltransferase RfbV n=2 Tax=Pandoraea communis TaxID=2508297 RepID=A0A5E4T740_9BURK|nr:Abequosyltransferase RfbV [Pandoraea communis]